MGKFEYEQWHFINSHLAHRDKCKGMYKKTPLLMEKGKVMEYSKYVANDLNHIATLHHTNCQAHYPRVMITEKVKGKYSLGGSNFRVEVRGSENSVCTTKDYFNGTYMVVCPKMASCVNITVQLKYINFDSYFIPKVVPLDILIFNSQWCPTDGHLDNQPCCQSQSQDGAPGGKWLHSDDGSWQWNDNGRFVRGWSANETARCLKRLNVVHLIGDSHIRYIADYLMHMKRGTPPSRLHRWVSFSENDIFFNWATFTTSVAEKIETLRTSNFSKRGITKRDVVLVSTGAWDMVHKGMNHFVESFNQTVLTQLKLLVHDPIWSRATTVYMTSVPFPQHLNLVEGSWFRTDFGLAAINYWVRLKMAELNIPVIDAFKTVLLRSGENVCNNHYICYLKTNIETVKALKGTVGFKIVDDMLQRICI